MKKLIFTILIMTAIAFGEEGGYFEIDGGIVKHYSADGLRSWSMSPSTDASVVDWIFPAGYGIVGQTIITDGSTNVFTWGANVTGHVMLGVNHTDSTTDTVSRGSIIYGNATPKWDELDGGTALGGAATHYFGWDGTDVGYRTIAEMASDSGALLADGTVALAGAWDMGSQATTNVNIDSGVITGITDLAVVDGGTGAGTLNDLITLTTHTTGNYVASITDGLAIDGGDGGSEGAAITIAFDPTELLGNRTWGDGSTDTVVWTWDRATGTDPTMTFGNGFVSHNGDLKILGDDLFMTTNTDKFLLVADGTNFNPVESTGDIIIDNTGVAALQNDTVAVAEFLASQDWGDMSTAADGLVSLDSDISPTFASLAVSDLTDTRVVFAGAGGELSDDADMTFSVDTLTVTKIGAFELVGKLTAGAIEIEGAAFDINGGTIDGITTLGLANSVDVGNWTITANGLTLDGTFTDGTASIVGGVGTGFSSITSTAFVGDLTGNADTATLASTVTVVDSTDATSFIAMFDSATGSLAVKTDGGLLYDASTGDLLLTTGDFYIDGGAGDAYTQYLGDAGPVQNTGATLPDTGASSSALASGDTAWGTPTGIEVGTEVNQATATIQDSMDADTDALYAAFDFSAIPTDATITGIVVEIRREADESDVTDTVVKLTKTGTVGVGNSKPNGSNWSGGGAETISYGTGTTDLWGAAPTTAEVRTSTFGVYVAAEEENNVATNIQVHWIKMTVYYTCPVRWTTGLDATDGSYRLSNSAVPGIDDRLIFNFDGTIRILDALHFTQSDGAERIDSDADGTLDLYAGTSINFNIGATEQISLIDGVLQPTTTNDIDLGTSSLEYKDLYLQGEVHLRDSAIGVYSQADGFMDLFADSGVRIGDSSAGAPTNYTNFSNGLQTMAGTARVLRSVDFEPDAVKKGGVGPTDSTEDGFPIHDYQAANDESVHIHWEIPHEYASGGEIHLHVEFFVDTAPGGAANVTWGVEYQKLSIGDNFNFGTTTTVITNTALTTGTPANDKKIHSSAEIHLVTTGFEPMDVVLIRIFRDADASETDATDNFGSDARVFNYHLMYLSDKLGQGI